MSQLWEEAKALFFELNQMPESERQAFIAERTAHSPELYTLLNDLIKGDAFDSVNTVDAISNITRLVGEEAKLLLQENYTAKQGDIFNDYEILDTLGQGGMGAVYLAKRHDAEFRQTVAIKVIHSQNLTQMMVQRFRQERQILASLRHPNIAQLIDGGETAQGLPYIVMEYVEGINIIEYCRLHKLSVKARLALFKQVIKAVDYAHQNLVIHRDLKPSNVLVTQQGDVKLLDFGIAKLLSTNSAIDNPFITQVETKVLTPINASPEQVKSENATTRTDVYGLCTLLYHILTEQALFAAENATSAEIQSWILEKDPAKPSENINETHSVDVSKLADEIQGDLDTIILKGLHKEPARRYSSVLHLLDDIQRFEQCYPIHAKPDSVFYKSKKFLRRNTTLSAVSGLFAISVAVFIVAILSQSKQLEMQRDIAIRASANASHVAEFLKDTFSYASPYVSGDKPVTPKDLVDRGAARIDSLNAEAVLLAQLQLSIADVYVGLLEFDSAQSLIESARTNIKSVESAPEDVLLTLEQTRVELAYAQGNFDVMGEMVDKSLQTIESALAMGQSNVLNVSYKNFYVSFLLMKSYLIIDTGEPSEALVYAQKAYEVALELGDDLTSEIGVIYSQLGFAYRRLFDFENSAKWLLLAAEAARDTYGDFNLELAYNHNQLASTYLRLGQIDTALEYGLSAFEIRDALYPDGHIEVVASLGILANIHSDLSQFEQAIDYRKQGEALIHRLLGKEHHYAGAYALSLASLYIKTKQLDEAEKQAKFGAEVLQTALPPTNVSQARGGLLLGQIAFHRGNYEQAVQLLNDAGNIAKANAPDGHWLIGEYYALLALSNAALGLREQAKLDKAKSLAAYKDIYGEESKQYKANLERVKAI